jgi:CRP-like cAMP-binding protein
MALLNQATRNATVRCLAPTDVLSLPQRDFSTPAAHVPELRRKFADLTAQRRRATERIFAQSLDCPGVPAVQGASVRLPAAGSLVRAGARPSSQGKSDRTLSERRRLCERVREKGSTVCTSPGSQQPHQSTREAKSSLHPVLKTSLHKSPLLRIIIERRNLPPLSTGASCQVEAHAVDPR